VPENVAKSARTISHPCRGAYVGAAPHRRCRYAPKLAFHSVFNSSRVLPVRSWKVDSLYVLSWRAAFSFGTRSGLYLFVAQNRNAAVTR